MDAKRRSARAHQIARELVRLREELLSAIDGDADEEITLFEGGDRFTVRILWRNCVMVASDTQRRRQTAGEADQTAAADGEDAESEPAIGSPAHAVR